MAYTYKNYEESDAVKRYREQLEQANQQRPGGFASPWQEKQQQAYDAVTLLKKTLLSAERWPCWIKLSRPWTVLHVLLLQK